MIGTQPMEMRPPSIGHAESVFPNHTRSPPQSRGQGGRRTDRVVLAAHGLRRAMRARVSTRVPHWQGVRIDSPFITRTDADDGDRRAGEADEGGNVLHNDADGLQDGRNRRAVGGKDLLAALDGCGAAGRGRSGRGGGGGKDCESREGDELREHGEGVERARVLERLVSVRCGHGRMLTELYT